MAKPSTCSTSLIAESPSTSSSSRFPKLKRQPALRALACFLFVVVLIGSCSRTNAPTAVIATHRTPIPDVGTADGRLVGKLLMNGRCILVRESDNGVLVHPSWPDGFQSNIQDDIVDNSGKIVARIGQVVVLAGGGSEWFNIDTVKADAPACRRFPTFVVDRVLAG